MSSVAEDNAIDLDTTESFSSVRIKPFSILSTKTRVENPHDDTQVFVEVQLREKSHVYLTKNDILVDMTLSRKMSDSSARHDFSSNLRFWNFFKQVVSRYDNKMANLCLEIKRSVVIIIQEEIQLSMLEMVDIKRFNESDDGGSEKDECVICLDEFKKENNVMKFECGHVFHTKCIIDRINKREPYNFCPSCMDELNANLIF
ncbi:hypothetical protein MKX03_028600 [Papaver bracteatum]|nr:hypothetical protein MKX03_028600 [Papaver bracteatum]